MDENRENVILQETPALKETPALQDVQITEMLKSGREKSGEYVSITPLLQKYISKDFCKRYCINHDEISLVLKKIRVENINRAT